MGNGVENAGQFQVLSLSNLLRGGLALIAHTGPDLMLAGVMTVVLVCSVLVINGEIRFLQASVGLPIGIMFVLIIYRGVLHIFNREYKPNLALILRDWLPFLLVTFIYENLHDLSGRFFTTDISPILYRWDIAIFGVEPTLWMQKFYSPILTDIMTISYALYFILPLVLMFFLSQCNKRFEFREMALALTFSFLIGFIGYIIWPCSPPRYFIKEIFEGPIQGFFLYNWLQGQWDNLSVISCGAFPSLHIGASAVALLYAWKFRGFSRLFNWIWWLYIPLVVSLWISTVYLRHHWVIDIFAGWALAVIGFAFSEYILLFWHNLKLKYGK